MAAVRFHQREWSGDTRINQIGRKLVYEALDHALDKGIGDGCCSALVFTPDRANSVGERNR